MIAELHYHNFYFYSFFPIISYFVRLCDVKSTFHNLGQWCMSFGLLMQDYDRNRDFGRRNTKFVSGAYRSSVFTATTADMDTHVVSRRSEG